MKHDAPAHLALPAELTIYTLGELQPAWLQCLDATSASDEEALRVDAAAVCEVDAAGMQLLLALSRSAHRRGRRLVLRDPAECLRQACADLGLDALLAAEASS
jgi:anti-anti-sigma regulatory factor